ncbi:MAG TPA: RNA methyltransferase [Candidatus Obscuribacterales bacterium]
MIERLSRHTYPTAPRHPLMVCASLVGHPANLGALCRTVEAFRLQSLIVNNGAIAHTSAFRGLAASSHQWQPLQDCPVEHLPDWLRHQAQQGYTAIALDLDAQAQPLPDFSYPQRSILVLGKELTGIPQHVRRCCSQTVTIPQFGLVESLNVQTAAAIAIYEYVRQWGAPG